MSGLLLGADMTRPTQEHVLAVALDDAESSALYSKALRQRVARELAKMQIATPWFWQTGDQMARCWAHSGKQLGWIVRVPVVDGDTDYEAYVAPLDGGSDRHLGTFSSGMEAQGVVDGFLIECGVVLCGWVAE